MRPRLTFLFLFFSIVTHAQFRLYEQGIDAYQAKNYEKAITHLNEYMDKSVRDKALDVEVHYVLALSYFKTNSYTSSVREFDRALELGHQNKGNIHWFMAKGYGQLRAFKESAEEFEKALADVKDPASQSKIYYDRGLQYFNQKQNQLAHDDVTKSLALSAGNKEAKILLTKLDEMMIPVSVYRDVSKNSGELIASNKDKKGVKPTTSVKPSDVKKKEEERKLEQKRVEEKRIADKIIEDQRLAENALAGKRIADKELEEKRFQEAKDVKAVIASTADKNIPAVLPEIAEEKPLTLAELYKNEKRYALVIGNAKYKNVAPLKNSVTDANDIAIELQKSNFEVIKVLDGDYAKMREAFSKFHEKLSSGPKDQTVGLFYYAGHGLQNEGENYLVPIEANIKYDDDIPRMCLPMHRVVLANMERSSTRMNIVIMDACRNNPFPAASRDIGGGGLAEIKRAKGSFIAYATSPGATASDGDGKNGLYTQELLKAMRKPARTIEQVFKEVRMNVLKLSDDKQNTWDSSNIIGEFYFRF
jgi:hypothetical protein